MLVCQFVTKAVCSYVIDWQTVRAQCPQGHQATATQSHSFFSFFISETRLLSSEAEEKERVGVGGWGGGCRCRAGALEQTHS